MNIDPPSASNVGGFMFRTDWCVHCQAACSRRTSPEYLEQCKGEEGEGAPEGRTAPQSWE